ncbi:hypothetical protein BN1232_03453 [Mycobacterium lentiflavum]|uniref:Uncharacterized protein n=1 Tax=Mycobacterium lentiflavum TaxID=141349 RepID=A0A0E4GZ70_MYCLN|nr:hypothetical protein [Mycobacterium lentiflavum]MEE3066332.1 hypothetical protein [Actinomycetota bacterium]ULP40559.1 hypothetical protein MJO58_16370 [Mycobacterium lentiflavum]CQD16039.1 hypothetical protein BN1232_03453 [Mycobacterium lentiflavum]
MSKPHPDIGPELRKLAEAILNGIDPAVRMAAAMTAGNGVGTGKCQQIWCPVCALAALASGDQHPLLTVIADHSIALLEVIRAIVNDVNDIDRSSGSPPQPPPDGSPGGGVPAEDPRAHEAGGRTRYQPIPVTIEE